MDSIFRQWIEPAYYKLYLIPLSEYRQKKLVKEIRKRGYAKVVFIVSSLPMWRFQSIYDSMRADARLRVQLVTYPFPTFSENQKQESMNSLHCFFEAHQMPFLDLSKEAHPGTVLRQTIDPDIIFYPQPYNNLFLTDLDSQYFSDKLSCYIPYAMLTAKEAWAYHNRLNNVAWRVFFQSESRKREAAPVLYNAGRNIVVTGDPLADEFTKPLEKDIWKKQEKTKKRVIWAPHSAITEGGLLHRDSFTWLSEAMLEIASEYKDRIQFAFKPHPKLLSVLYDFPGWGKARADAYYQKWATGTNTQLETGDYIDLFKSSDAMVHDSSSFSVEYHFTGKPVLFLSSDLSKILEPLNEFGRAAILAHYQGKSKDDIIGFLDTIVLKGEDYRFEERNRFRETQLLPAGNKTVAENIYQEFVVSLWG